MTPAPRRSGQHPRSGTSARRGQPARTGARRSARAPEPEYDDEEGLEEDELPPGQKPPLSVTQMVAAGAGLLFAILLLVFVMSGHGFILQVENLDMDPIKNVVVRINGESYNLGTLGPIAYAEVSARRSPGNDVEVDYVVPNRGPFTKKLPKGPGTYAPDFANFKEKFRIRLSPQGIVETLYPEEQPVDDVVEEGHAIGRRAATQRGHHSSRSAATGRASYYLVIV
jgi:hypothetical protein